jgi:hypothetical protein
MNWKIKHHLLKINLVVPINLLIKLKIISLMSFKSNSLIRANLFWKVILQKINLNRILMKTIYIKRKSQLLIIQIKIKFPPYLNQCKIIAQINKKNLKILDWADFYSLSQN